MEKKNKKLLTISTLATFVPILVGLVLWKGLPASLPVHFNFEGVADGFANKAIVVFGLPILMALINAVVLYFVFNDPKKNNIGDKMLSVVAWIIPLIANVMNYAIYAISLGHQIDIIFLTTILIGVVFVLIGNYMGKNHQNYTVGIKLPWTLNSQENWNKTHRFAAKLWVIGGLAMMASSFLNLSSIFLVIVLILTIVPIIYSFILYKKGI